MRATRGSTAPMSSAPLVSSETAWPASHSAASSGRQAFCASGSPPVTQTVAQPKAATRCRISSVASNSPPLKA